MKIAALVADPTMIVPLSFHLFVCEFNSLDVEGNEQHSNTVVGPYGTISRQSMGNLSNSVRQIVGGNGRSGNGGTLIG